MTARFWTLVYDDPASLLLPRAPTERFAVWQLETAAPASEEAERPRSRLRCFVVLRSPVDLEAASAMFPGAIAREATGTPQQNIKRCTNGAAREAGPWERGDRPRPRVRRAEVEAAIRTLEQDIGKKRPFRRLAELHPEAERDCAAGIRFVAGLSIPARTRAPEVRVFLGGTAADRARAAHEWLPDAWTWTPALGPFVDGYFGHREAVFEEFGGEIPCAEMLVTVLDAATGRAPVGKAAGGGTVKFVAERVAITSAAPPAEWYGQRRERELLLDRLCCSAVPTSGSCSS